MYNLKPFNYQHYNILYLLLFVLYLFVEFQLVNTVSPFFHVWRFLLCLPFVDKFVDNFF